MLGQNLQNVGDQIMDFYLAKTYKKGFPKTIIAHGLGVLANKAVFFHRINIDRILIIQGAIGTNPNTVQLFDPVVL